MGFSLPSEQESEVVVRTKDIKYQLEKLEKNYKNYFYKRIFGNFHTNVVCNIMTPIRIVYYPDRIVVQNISTFVNNKDLSDINAIIDASNKLATCSGQETPSLVLPFDGKPTETNQEEPPGRPVGVEAAVGLLGVLYLFSGPFAIFALQVKRVGELPGAIPIYAIAKVSRGPRKLLSNFTCL